MMSICHVEESIASLRELSTRERVKQDAFAAFLSESRKHYYVLTEHEGEEGKLRARFLQKSHEESRRLGFNGGRGAWEHLLGAGAVEPDGGESVVETGNSAPLVHGVFSWPWRLAKAA